MVKKHLTLLSLKNVHTYVYSNYVGDDQICDSNSLVYQNFLQMGREI